MPQPQSQSDVQPNSTSPGEHPKDRRSLGKTGASTCLPSTPARPALRNPTNRLRRAANQREVFVEHLTKWTLNHDSSTYFHGKIGLRPQNASSGGEVALGKSVRCVLIDSSSADAAKDIVIRLFPPRHRGDDTQDRQRHVKHGCTVPNGALDRSSPHDHHIRGGRKRPDSQLDYSDAPYKLVIRSASGWVPAREYLNKHYFAHLAKQAKSHRINQVSDRTEEFGQDALLQNSSKQLASSHFRNDTVTVRPLFRPFGRLPPELQDLILFQAVGYTRTMKLVRRPSTYSGNAFEAPRSPISISRLFQISKAINDHMVPHILRSTNFHFGVTGFTNFLWQLGPVNRSELQHFTFNFGKDSLLHCIRWLAPDPVYELFEPPVSTSPANLVYFWRCQIQDLTRGLNLLTLTIDVTDVPYTDWPMLVRILSSAFGSVKHIRLLDTQSDGSRNLLATSKDPTFGDCWDSGLTWKVMSMRYYHGYKHLKFHMRRVWQIHVDDCDCLEQWMDKDRGFFDS